MFSRYESNSILASSKVTWLFYIFLVHFCVSKKKVLMHSSLFTDGLIYQSWSQHISILELWWFCWDFLPSAYIYKNGLKFTEHFFLIDFWYWKSILDAWSWLFCMWYSLWTIHLDVSKFSRFFTPTPLRRQFFTTIRGRFGKF